MAKYYANDKYRAELSQAYVVGQQVLYVTAVPNNVPTILVAFPGTEKETIFTVEGKTVNSVTGVNRIRGANVNLDMGTPIVCLNNEEFINQFVTPYYEGDLALKTLTVGTIKYIGLALPGSAESDPVWQCMKFDGSVLTWADGNSDFDNIVTDLASLNYS